MQINSGLIYQILSKTITDGIETSTIEWTGETEVEADEALAKQAAKTSAPKKQDAIEFLRDQLKHGPKSLESIDEAAQAQGIAWATCI